jgi:hypothetical protein
MTADRDASFTPEQEDCIRNLGEVTIVRDARDCAFNARTVFQHVELIPAGTVDRIRLGWALGFGFVLGGTAAVLVAAGIGRVLAWALSL